MPRQPCTSPAPIRRRGRPLPAHTLCLDASAKAKHTDDTPSPQDDLKDHVKLNRALDEALDRLASSIVHQDELIRDHDKNAVCAPASFNAHTVRYLFVN